MNRIDKERPGLVCSQLLNRYQLQWEAQHEGRTIRTSMSIQFSTLTSHRGLMKLTFAGTGRKLLPTWGGFAVQSISRFKGKTY